MVGPLFALHVTQLFKFFLFAINGLFARIEFRPPDVVAVQLP